MPSYTHCLFKTTHDVLLEDFTIHFWYLGKWLNDRNFLRQHMATNQQTKTQPYQSNSHTVAVNHLTHTVITVQSPLLAAAHPQVATTFAQSQGLADNTQTTHHVCFGRSDDKTGKGTHMFAAAHTGQPHAGCDSTVH